MEKAKSKNVQILLPCDFVCADKFDKDAKTQPATLEVRRKLHSKRVKNNDKTLETSEEQRYDTRNEWRNRINNSKRVKNKDKQL